MDVDGSTAYSSGSSTLGLAQTSVQWAPGQHDNEVELRKWKEKLLLLPPGRESRQGHSGSSTEASASAASCKSLISESNKHVLFVCCFRCRSFMAVLFNPCTAAHECTVKLCHPFSLNRSKNRIKLHS